MAEVCHPEATACDIQSCWTEEPSARYLGSRSVSGGRAGIAHACRGAGIAGDLIEEAVPGSAWAPLMLGLAGTCSKGLIAVCCEYSLGRARLFGVRLEVLIRRRF